MASTMAGRILGRNSVRSNVSTNRMKRAVRTPPMMPETAPATSAGLVERLCLYDWPFNVRELETLTRSMVLTFAAIVMAASTIGIYPLF